ncbi:MAG: aminopeptidase N [Gammaproteobacteria bacterium]|nr:MAG: aminopeptidase N [Gammaproteobacteria bacterium]
MLRENSREAIYLKDYRPPDYLIDRIDLDFDIRAGSTRVKSVMQLRLNPDGSGPGSPLVLDGEGLELNRLALDGTDLAADAYSAEGESLSIPEVPERFTLEVETTIRPEDNTGLEGLYKAERIYCTQCEAEGFRKITYYPDRPDVMARFTTRISADKGTCPVLLSNGNLVDEGDLEDGRHWAKWEDPHRKPCYLFALVAGNLAHVEDHHTTPSGRDVTLRIYAEQENLDKCGFALQALKDAMRWDEQRFGLECDLDNYNIVATNDFNMGAMENKGLNIFNAQYVLASPETATDTDFQQIEAVIGHEYFHNWTGNRVTCRDWFQLSLKEGLTVFRDQEFSADMQSRAVKRIEDVRRLRGHQFPEDAGPMSHSVRPDSYIEVNNFYTATVYEKGAEVVRMYDTLLSREGFRKGIDLYFERHDGQAVTCDDFRAAMADANGRDFKQFGRWYAQSGTPVVEARGEYDGRSRQYTLTLRQHTPSTPGQNTKKPFCIPVAVGLLDSTGKDLPLKLQGEGQVLNSAGVLELTTEEQQFTFTDLSERPVPSLLRGFSAPVQLRYDYTPEEMAFLMANDSDPFNRWEAAQQFATRLLLEQVQDIRNGKAPSLSPVFVDAFGTTLRDESLDKALIAEAIMLPGETYLADQMDVIDIDAIHQAREFTRGELARALHDNLLAVFDGNQETGPYQLEVNAIARRQLKNTALGYLMSLDDPALRERCAAQFETAGNMTDRLAALARLVHSGATQAAGALQSFHATWQHDPLVINKWFSIQATDERPGALERVQSLANHPDFTLRNPNRVRALLGAYGMHNRVGFHVADGGGYRFMTDRILELDALNPQIASRLAGLFNHWKRFDQPRRDAQNEQLERMAGKAGLSKNTFEIVSKALK